MADEEPAVRVTLTTIYNRMVNVENQITELSAQLPNHMTVTKQKQEEYELRLENHGTRLATLDTRQTATETQLAIIASQQKPRAPWYAVAGGVAVIVTGAGSLIALLSLLARIPPL